MQTFLIMQNHKSREAGAISNKDLLVTDSRIINYSLKENFLRYPERITLKLRFELHGSINMNFEEREIFPKKI